MCYSHFGTEVHNGAIFVMQRGFINDCYKVNPVGQWGKNSGNGNGVCRSLGAMSYFVRYLKVNKVIF